MNKALEKMMRLSEIFENFAAKRQNPRTFAVPGKAYTLTSLEKFRKAFFSAAVCDVASARFEDPEKTVLPQIVCTHRAFGKPYFVAVTSGQESPIAIELSYEEAQKSIPDLGLRYRPQAKKDQLSTNALRYLRANGEAELERVCGDSPAINRPKTRAP